MKNKCVLKKIIFILLCLLILVDEISTLSVIKPLYDNDLRSRSRGNFKNNMNNAFQKIYNHKNKNESSCLINQTNSEITNSYFNHFHPDTIEILQSYQNAELTTLNPICLLIFLKFQEYFYERINLLKVNHFTNDIFYFFRSLNFYKFKVPNILIENTNKSKLEAELNMNCSDIKDFNGVIKNIYVKNMPIQKVYIKNCLSLEKVYLYHYALEKMQIYIESGQAKHLSLIVLPEIDPNVEIGNFEIDISSNKLSKIH